jgi:ABC-type Na+ transport system ATPase subunit NatA
MDWLSSPKEPDGREPLIQVDRLRKSYLTRRRARGFGRALISLARPDILFLDEPIIGLDVVSKLAVRAFIKRINRGRGSGRCCARASPLDMLQIASYV